MSRRGLLIFIGMMVVSLNSFCIYRYVKSNSKISASGVELSSRDLRSGDVLLRRSKGAVSHWFARMSQHDPYFSHAGIVLKQQGQAMVLSCTQDHIPSGLICESVQEFFNGDITDGYAVYRYPLSENEVAALEMLLKRDVNHPVRFDHNFDLGSDSSYYCTEYIASRIGLLHPGLTTVSSGKGWNYIAPDDLYRNAGGKFIFTRR